MPGDRIFISDGDPLTAYSNRTRTELIMTASVAERRIKKELQKLKKAGDEVGMTVEVGSSSTEWFVTIVGESFEPRRPGGEVGCRGRGASEPCCLQGPILFSGV